MGYTSAEIDQLFTLHDLTATWLSDNVPLYVPQGELHADKMSTYNGLPVVKNNAVDYSMQFPGSMAQNMEPRAAHDLHIIAQDIIEAIFTPAQYSIEDSKPQLWTPSTMYAIRDQAHRRVILISNFRPILARNISLYGMAEGSMALI